MEEQLELELKYNSIFNVIKDFQLIRYKISMFLFFVFVVLCLFIYGVFIGKVQYGDSTNYIIFLAILFPFCISALFDYYQRKTKIRIYQNYFEIPILKSSIFSRNSSAKAQRVMTKFKFLKLAKTSQYKDTYTLHFVHDIENEDETIKNKNEFIIKSLTHTEISKLDTIFNRRLSFTRQSYYTRR